MNSGLHQESKHLKIDAHASQRQNSIDQFKVIDQEKSQISHEAKEAIHICKEDPELNKNVGKMVIPHVFDPILGIKPKNPCISSILSQDLWISRYWY